jgi:hypothetical protein
VQFVSLYGSDAVVNAENGCVVFFVNGKFVYTNDDLFAAFDIALVIVGTAGNFILYKTLLNGAYTAALVNASTK